MSAYNSNYEFRVVGRDLPFEGKHDIKVLMPKWWNKRLVYGYTDGVPTYCCELYPSVFVDVPYFDYSGYFREKDLRVIP